VLGGQRQIDQRLHRPVGTQQRVGHLEQRVRAGGQAVIEVGPEPGQHRQGLDARSVIQHTQPHGLGVDHGCFSNAHDRGEAVPLSGERRKPSEGTPAAVAALDRWLSWARRCRIPAFTELARKIKRHYDAILHAIVEQLSNGLIESTNTKTRLIVRRGFGFRSADAIIALVMLCLGGNRPTLPRRQPG
jgi:hypothetical protein